MALKTLLNQKDRDQLLQRIAQLQPDSKANWGRMNAHQMVCHVADAIYFALENRPVAMMDNRAGPLIKWFALSVPLPWPKGFNGPIELLQEGGGTKPRDFEADRKRASDSLGSYAATGCKTQAPHPFFGPLTPKHWARWAYLHTDHHLRQFGV